MKDSPTYDVFLSHNGADKAAVETLARHLRAQGLDPFLDKWHLIPGDPWQEALEKALDASQTVAVFIGPSGVSTWENEEMRAALEMCANDRSRRVIPVLLPGAPDPQKDQLPRFLRRLTWVDLHAGLDDSEGLHRLVCGIRGIAPDFGSQAESPSAGLAANVWETTRVIPPQLMKAYLEGDSVLLWLELSTAAVGLRSPLYVERKADLWLKRQMEIPATITTIRGGRQMGKTSLFLRGIDYARKLGTLVLQMELPQVFDPSQLADMNAFFRQMAYAIAQQANVDPGNVNEVWESPSSPQSKLTEFMEHFVLHDRDRKVLLAMDEADYLLETDFYSQVYSLIRSWHNLRVLYDPWQRFSVVMSISTHPSLLIAEYNQSPFNVGIPITLDDLDEDQVRYLNDLHGGPLKEGEIPAAMALLGGHPYLIRQALYTMVTERMSWAKLDSIADKDHGPFSGHLHYYWQLLQSDEKLKQAARNVALYKTCPDSPELLRLIAACVVQEDEDRCLCRYDLYKRYFGRRLQ